MSNEKPQHNIENDPTLPVVPAVPQPVQPYYSPSQPGAPIRTPDFVPGQQPFPQPFINPEQTPPIPVVPGEAPAPIFTPDPGGPRVVGPGGRIVPAPGGAGQADPSQAPVPPTRTPDQEQHQRQDPNRGDPSRRNKEQL